MAVTTLSTGCRTASCSTRRSSARRRAADEAAGGALARPRQVQVGQRHARPSGRDALLSRLAQRPARMHPRRRHGGAARRRRVRDRCERARGSGDATRSGTHSRRRPRILSARGHLLIADASVGIASRRAGTSPIRSSSRRSRAVRAKAEGRATSRSSTRRWTPHEGAAHAEIDLRQASNGRTRNLSTSHRQSSTRIAYRASKRCCAGTIRRKG